MEKNFEGQFDLLGDPVSYPGSRRGRPPHVPTDEKRRLVIGLCAMIRTDAEIASALGIDEKTLRKHYSREIKAKAEARFRVEAKLLQKALEEIDKGSVAAMKFVAGMMGRRELEVVGGHRPAKPAKLGKKEQANRDARLPPQGWGELLPVAGRDGRLN